MPRVLFDGRDMEMPGVVDGVELRRLMNLRRNERPVVVQQNGDYSPVQEHDRLNISPGMRLDKIQRLPEG